MAQLRIKRPEEYFPQVQAARETKKVLYRLRSERDSRGNATMLTRCFAVISESSEPKETELKIR